jgi:hypothetical protein
MPEFIVREYHVYKICVLLGYYAASYGNCLPTFRDNVSVSPPSRCFLIYLFLSYFLLLVYLYFIYLALSLYIPPLLLLYSIYVFPAVLADGILGTPSSFTLSLSTPLSPWFYPIRCHHAYWLLPSAHFPHRIYVIGAGFLSSLLGLLTREDGTDTLSRNVGKQLPHDAA